MQCHGRRDVSAQSKPIGNVLSRISNTKQRRHACASLVLRIPETDTEQKLKRVPRCIAAYYIQLLLNLHLVYYLEGCKAELFLSFWSSRRSVALQLETQQLQKIVKKNTTPLGRNSCIFFQARSGAISCLCL